MTTKLLSSFILLLFWNSIFVFAQSEKQKSKIESLLKNGQTELSETYDWAERFDFFSKKLLGIQYKAGVLDEFKNERLVIDLDGLDCVTFIENVVALSATLDQDDPNFDTFAQELTNIRYANGQILGYESRLHYFSDWMLTKEYEGNFSILFQDSEFAEPLQRISFMSQNWQKYPRLKENPDLVEEIVLREDIINEAELVFIPQRFITTIEDELLTGDIVAFVTSVKGLDVSHTGIIKKIGSKTHFYHASTTGLVKLEEKSLQDYVTGIKSMKGILVGRFISN